MIAGRVTDANTGNPLPSVEISVDGTTLHVASEHDGSYSVAGLATGPYRVTFSYIGYRPVTRAVTVSGATKLDAALGEEVVTLSEFRVEGVREGQARALNEQRTAGNITNIVASDAIGNFPDKNVAEALARVSGVSTVTLRGEANYITIRGATPAWNSVSLDGMSLLSANEAHSDALGHDMRSVQLDVVPSSQVGSMEVVKTLTPDLGADSVGGAVLLKSKSAFDTDRRVITASSSGSYNDLAARAGYRAAFNYSDRLGANQDWGVQFSSSYEQKKELEESNETNDWFLMTATVNGTPVSGFVPTTALQTYVDDIRDRQAFGGAIEKKIGTEGRLFVRGFTNTFKEFDERYGARFMPGLTATGGNLDATQPVSLSPAGTIVQFTSTKATTRRLLQPQAFNDKSAGVSAGGSWQAADWGLEGSFGYSRATEWFVTEQGQWNSKTTSNRVAFDYTSNNFWRFKQLSGTDFFDPSGLGFNSAKYREDFSKNWEYEGKLDAHRTLLVAATPVKLQLGWKSRWNTKSNDNNVANYNSILNGGTLNLNDPRLDGVIDPDTGFLGGRYDAGPYAATSKWQAFFNQNRAPLDNTTGLFLNNSGVFGTNSNSRNATLSSDYKIHEDIHAGYLRADWNWGKLGFIAGARLERTDLAMRATKVDSSKSVNDPLAYTPYRSDSSYDNWAPSLHLRYPVSTRLVLRAAWTNTLARPNAVSMVPSLTVDPINLTLSGGNPDLHAVKSMNWDASADYYLSSIGLVSVGAFTKSLDGPIYQSLTVVQFDAGNGPQPFTYSTYLNAGRATLQGVEFSYQQQLRFLPSPFDGLGLYTNYTVIDANVKVPTRPGEKFPLFNQSKWLGNVALFYQKYKITGRLAYTFRSPYLTTLILPGTDTYFDKDHRLDFQAGYKFRDHWTVQLTANNLENTPERQYHGNPSRQEFYGLTGRFYSLGLSWEY